jgi:hypothetical protein
MKTARALCARRDMEAKAQQRLLDVAFQTAIALALGVLT